MKNTLRIAALLALALGAPAAEAAKFYKWTDELGATHYTAEPPPAGAKASEVRIKTSSVTDAEEAQKAPAAGTAAPAAGGKAAPAKGKDKPKEQKDAKDPKDDGKTPEQYAEKCKGLRANLKAMEEHARVKEMTESGEPRVLTDEEKNARLDETRREIKAFCE